ncbi:MAG: hypothetical protein ACLR23_27815 [Clostridia bacterium]
MHTGEVSNGNDQRAHGAKFSAANGETTIPAGIQNEKCTPVRRATTATSGHTVPNSPPPAARRPCRRGYKTKNARRHGEQRQRPARTRCQIPRRQRRDNHTGGDTKRKMHAGKVRNGSGRRAHGAKFSAASGETTMPAGIQNEKCTPVRRTTAAASGHTVPNSPPPAPKRSCQRGYKTKNARRHGEQRQRPAGTRCQILRRQRQNDHAGGDTE